MRYLLPLLLLLPSIVIAAPTISTVSGTIADGQSITISGSDFGSGPTIVLFDDFETETSGQRMDTTATVGSWTGSGGIGTRDFPYATSIESSSGNLAINTIEGDTWGAWDQVYVGMSETTEIFISYYAWVPIGYYYPYATSTASFSGTSSFKAAWLAYNGSTTEDDLVVPTNAGTQFSISGNDWVSSITKIGLGQDWWSWTQPNRLTTWIKSGSPVTSNGTIYTQMMGSSRSDQTTIDRPIFDSDGVQNHAWNRVVVPGNFEIRSGYNDAMLYDDIYIASGENAAARVEIGNAATYAACTKLAIATHDNWSTTSITATVRQGVFSQLESAYLYIIDSSNSASAGYAVTLGSVSSTTRYYLDADGDGYSPGTYQNVETDPGATWYTAEELTAITGDCDDSDATIYPGAADPCKDCDAGTTCLQSSTGRCVRGSGIARIGSGTMVMQ